MAGPKNTMRSKKYKSIFKPSPRKGSVIITPLPHYFYSYCSSIADQ